MEIEYVIFYRGKAERFDNKADAITFSLGLKSDNIPYKFIIQSKEHGVW